MKVKTMKNKGFISVLLLVVILVAIVSFCSFAGEKKNGYEASRTGQVVQFKCVGLVWKEYTVGLLTEGATAVTDENGPHAEANVWKYVLPIEEAGLAFKLDKARKSHKKVKVTYVGDVGSEDHPGVLTVVAVEEVK